MFLPERPEQDACDQHPVRTNEGEPTLLDSESVPVQRYICMVARCVLRITVPVSHHPVGGQPTSSLLSTSPLAKVACVKSRDMHWALVAHRDQRDINLSSLRMLIVADGANPCKQPLPWGREGLPRFCLGILIFPVPSLSFH